MAAKAPIFEQRKLQGVSQFLLQNTDEIILSDTTCFSDHITDQTQVVAIIDMHWSTDGTGLTVTYNKVGSTSDSIQLYGNGAWARTNGFYPIASDADISVAGDGTVQILVKKLEGYAQRDDR